MRTVGRSRRWLSRMVNSFKPTGAAACTSISAMLAAGGGCGFEILHESPQSWLSAFHKNLNALLAIQHPSGERVGASEAINKRTKANALHHAANSNGACTGHRSFHIHHATAALPADLHDLAIFNQHGHAALSGGQHRACAGARHGSASTSYSTKSQRFHSSHSRISCVCGQRAVP